MTKRHVVDVYHDHHWYSEERFRWRWQAALFMWMMEHSPNEYMGRYVGRDNA